MKTNQMNKAILTDQELKVRALEIRNKELIEALRPFAEFGPDVEKYKDGQAFMGAAQIRAGHFRKAYHLLVRLEVLPLKSPGLDKSHVL